MAKNDDAWLDQIEVIKQNLLHLTQVVEEVAADTILPMLERHYNASGLKVHSGVLKQAITKKGAKGNIFRISMAGNTSVHLTLGVDTDAIDYHGVPLEGRRAVVPVKAKVLRWIGPNGKPIFSKYSKPVPPHPEIMMLSDGELKQVEEEISKRMDTEVKARRL